MMVSKKEKVVARLSQKKKKEFMAYLFFQFSIFKPKNRLFSVSFFFFWQILFVGKTKQQKKFMVRLRHAKKNVSCEYIYFFLIFPLKNNKTGSFFFLFQFSAVAIPTKNKKPKIVHSASPSRKKECELWFPSFKKIDFYIHVFDLHCYHFIIGVCFRFNKSYPKMPNEP